MKKANGLGRASRVIKIEVKERFQGSILREGEYLNPKGLKKRLKNNDQIRFLDKKSLALLAKI